MTIFLKILPGGKKLFHADGPTHVTKQMVAFRNFTKAPKKPGYLFKMLG
jgi:hypothetical protein